MFTDTPSVSACSAYSNALSGWPERASHPEAAAAAAPSLGSSSTSLSDSAAARCSSVMNSARRSARRVRAGSLSTMACSVSSDEPNSKSRALSANSAFKRGSKLDSGIGVSGCSGVSSGSDDVRGVPLAAGSPACAEEDWSLPAGETHPTSTASKVESKKGAVKCLCKRVIS